VATTPGNTIREFGRTIAEFGRKRADAKLMTRRSPSSFREIVSAHVRLTLTVAGPAMCGRGGAGCRWAHGPAAITSASSNAVRSSRKVHARMTPARWKSTLTMRYVYQGHACARSSRDGTAGWSGCEW
jgi:hypothetical protein